MDQFKTVTLPTGITVQWAETCRGTMIAEVKSEKYEQLCTGVR